VRRPVPLQPIRTRVSLVNLDTDATHPTLPTPLQLRPS
jgi:hypothetical protein